MSAAKKPEPKMLATAGDTILTIRARRRDTSALPPLPGALA